MRLGVAFGPDPGLPRLVTRTAGTTGAPRRILRSQRSWHLSAAVLAQRFGLGPNDSYGILGDLSHSLSFYALIEGLHLGAAVHLLHRPTPAAAARALRAAGITVLYATPTQVRALDLVLEPGARLTGLRVLIVGGGPYDAAAARAVQHRCPDATVALFYGTSETSFLTLATPPAPTGAAAAFPGVRLQIDAPGSAERDTAGRLWVHSPYLAMGYAAGDAVAASAVQRRADGFVSFGERGIAQSDGSFVLVGRGAEAVTVSDRTVFPAAIETWLMAQEGIAHAAVLARPDPLRGHRLEAAICPKGSDPGGLRAGLRRAFGPSGCPARIMALDDWPLLPSGKTDRAALQARLGRA